MPHLITKRNQRRCLATVMVGKNRLSKLFPDASRTSWAAAVAWEERTKKALKENRGLMITVQIWADRYLEFARVRYLRKTYQSKAAAFGRLLHFLSGNKEVSKISNADCLRYLTKQARQRSGNAANRDRKEFGTAFEFGRLYLGFSEDNPWRQVDKFPEEKYSRYVPTMADFERVMAVASGPDRVMLIALLHLAARKSELFGLKWTDIDYENSRVRLFTRKRKGGNREEDWLPATTILILALKGWEDARSGTKLPGKTPDHHYVFASCISGKRFKGRDDLLKRLCAKAGVRRFSFHSIRHLTAMTLYRAGSTTQHIQLVLRHLDPRTTSKYLRRIGIEEVRGTLEDTLNKGGGNKGDDPPSPPP